MPRDRAHPQVYRAPMHGSVDRALRIGVCGLPGVLDPPPHDLQEAVARTADERAAARLGRFAAVPDGAFVWTRSDHGHHLGRLDGPWRYDAAATARAVDLVHVRPCRWLPEPVPEDAVPAGTLATFARGGRNFQRTHTPGTAGATAAMWQALAGG